MKKLFAFVLMPFDKAFDDVYRLGIKETAEKLNIIAERVDEQLYRETMLEQIYKQIGLADVIIADMSDKNPNVFYEVGYAHAKEKQCILLTQKAEDIPFDLKHHRHLIYDGSISKLKDRLEPELLWSKEQLIQPNENALSVKIKNQIGYLTKEKICDTIELTIEIDLRNESKKKSIIIEAVYLHTGPDWSFTQSSGKCTAEPYKHKKYQFVQRHFIQRPLDKFSPNVWAPIKIVGTKRVYLADRKDEYPIKGHCLLEIITPDGPLEYQLEVDTLADEIPF